MTDGLQLPWSAEAERELLGAPFVDARTLDRARAIVEPRHFYHAAHRAVWEALCSVWDASASVDFVLVREELARRNGAVPSKQWAELLGGLLDRVGTTGNVEHYAEIVRTKARLRAVVDVAHSIAAEAITEPDDVDSFTARSEANLRKASEDGSADTLERSDRVYQALESFSRAKSGDERERGVLVRHRAVDEWLDGLPRKLSVIMGRPGMGKSALALGWAIRVALAGGRVWVWSGEMDSAEVWGRWISLLSGVPYPALTNRHALGTDWVRSATDAAHRIADSAIAIDCATALTADQIASRAGRARRELGGLDLIVVDHFHLMKHPRTKGERSDEAMGHSSGRLRDLAKELGAAVALCAQLNRESGRRPDHRPVPEDLRECGALEQDAQLIISPFRPYVYDQTADKGEARILVCKNRNGPTGDIPARFLPPTIAFVDA